MAIEISNWEKFKLLLWKNWILQWNQKVLLFIELIAPVLFASIFILVRVLVTVRSGPEKVFQEFPINNLFLLLKYAAPKKHINAELVYSPSNKYLDAIVKAATETLQIPRYRSFRNAWSLNNALMAKSYLAGVEFPDKLAHIKTFPRKLSFALRFPSEQRTSDQEFPRTWQTNRLFPTPREPGPRNINSYDGGAPAAYTREGFIPIQHAIVMSYLKLISNTERLPEIVMSRFPHPDFRDDHFLIGIRTVVPLIFILSYIAPCVQLTKQIAAEKENQIKEVLKIMGLQNWIHWTALFVKSLLTLCVPSLTIALLFTTEYSNGLIVLNYCDWMAFFLFLLSYSISTICFCFMMAVFFSRANTAAAVTCVSWFITFLPFSFGKKRFDSMGIGEKYLWCLVSNTAMGFGMDIILAFEETGEGFQFVNMFRPASEGNDMTVGGVIVMMLLSSLISMMICLYVEQIYAGEYGVARKWYFPCTRNFWCPKAGRRMGESGYEILGQKKRGAFEEEPPDLSVGFEVIDLQKRFGYVWVIKGITLRMYKNEITVLLGHNGSGKTTIISMITGMITPTTGTTLINGCDIRNDTERARRSLGICPQHNILYDNMSVKQHLMFFCRIKGLKGNAMKEEVWKYLRMINLDLKADIASANLSGGMKRKLCVCCAMCGGTKVVLCDEPTSGMDPAARRQLWNLLQSEKNGRTLLLTTHFMDEADVLADRIAIICHGELKAYGTPFFLKKKYGSGYNLISVKRDNCNVPAVTSLLNKYIRDIQPASNVGAELTYRLPEEFSSIFPILLGELEAKSNELGIDGFGIQSASLEEVFMKVGADSPTSGNHLIESDSESDSDSVNESLDSETGKDNSSVTSKDLRNVNVCLNQWEAMLLKKILYTWRTKLIFLLQCTIAITFPMVAILIGKYNDIMDLPRILITLWQYPSTATVLEMSPVVKRDSIESKIGYEYKNFIEEGFNEKHKLISLKDKSFKIYMLKLRKEDSFLVNSVYLAAATIDNGKIISWFNNYLLHTAPLSLNILHNAIARVLIGPNTTIGIHNFPLPFTAKERITQVEMDEDLASGLTLNITFCMVILCVFYIVSLIKENASGSKMLQFISGVRALAFWITQLLWDMTTFFVCVFLIICTIAYFQQNGYSEFDELCRYFIVLIIFGLAALPLTYLLSFLYKEPANGFVQVSLIFLFTGQGCYILYKTLTFPKFNERNLADQMAYFMRIFPHFSLALSLDNLNTNGQIRKICERHPEISKENLCQVLPQCCNYSHFFGWESPGILKEITYLLAVAICVFSLIILIEYRVCQRFNCLWITKKPPKSNTVLDDDVEAEKKHISIMSQHKKAQQYLVLDKVSKYYKKFLAVNQISFSVREHECFGLLGINGAGKTTTFKMITGDTRISSGAAYVKGINLSYEMSNVFQEMGYCPQGHALMDDLTGRETLYIFCLLRGLSKNRISEATMNLAQSFGFRRHLNKLVKTYSGGNKRKLSAALAVIESPSLIVLDEPTTGMDPATRRQLWNVICRLRDFGKAIVITSHNMTECEVLCTRLAIMVNGELMCIGSIQHLKNKFSKGFILKIKVENEVKGGKGGNNSSETSKMIPSSERFQDNINFVKQSIQQKYSEAILQEEYYGMLTYYLPISTVKWSEVFDFVEQNRSRLKIEDYSVSQTTLEEIFLEFAKLQREDKRSRSK